MRRVHEAEDGGGSAPGGERVQTACVSLDGRFRLCHQQVHVVPTEMGSLCDGPAMARMIHLKAPSRVFGDIATASIGEAELLDAGASVDGVLSCLSTAVSQAGLSLGRARDVRRMVGDSLSALSCWGANYHNDCYGLWPEALFWVMAVDVEGVEFCVHQLGVRHLLRPWDVVIFDPCLGHGLAAAGDGGMVEERSFVPKGGAKKVQAFLAGELRLSDRRWRAMGLPWKRLRKEAPRLVDMAGASFDERSGVLLSA